jgi:hypothetical protein
MRYSISFDEIPDSKVKYPLYRAVSFPPISYPVNAPAGYYALRGNCYTPGRRAQCIGMSEGAERAGVARAGHMSGNPVNQALAKMPVLLSVTACPAAGRNFGLRV